MKVILEHIKTRTIPHDTVHELLYAGIKFYEGMGYAFRLRICRLTLTNLGCLIVQVHDHKSASTTSQASPSSSGPDKHVPFSIHNYNPYLTPSSYVPYPPVNAPNTESGVSSRESGSGSSSTNAADNVQTDNTTSNPESNGKPAVTTPKIFTVVLFPTPLSLEEEVLVFVNTPDPRSNNRKPSQHNTNNRTPSSATLPHPPTPLSAVPPTPSTSGPPVKKQKMLVGEKDIRSFESKVIQATAPPLYLEPVDNLQDAQRVLQSLTGPLHREDYPAPKTRKRTVAELAADEALAAQEQRFMLIMDERLAPSASGAAGGKSKTADGEGGTASFEPRFERFKTLEAIKLTLVEKAEREKEAKQQIQVQQQLAKAKHEQQEREARQIQEKKLAEHAAKEIQLRNYQQSMAQRQAIQNQANMQNAQAQEARQNQHANPPVTSGMVANGQPHMVTASQPHHSSPIVRNMTPHSNSSPIVGNAMVSHPGQSVPMNVTASGQGNASSPARPPSALQHGHPAGGAAMVHQRSQQPISRRGTPQMNSTPSMQHVTPVMNHATPTSRMGHVSPPNAMAHTPTLAQNAMAAQHLAGVGQQLTPELQAQVMANRSNQAILMMQHQHQHQQRLQNSSPHQMSPGRPPVSMTNLQQMASQRNYENYQQSIRNHHQAMSNGTSQPHPNQPHLGQAGQHPGQAQTQPQQQPLPQRQVGVPQQPHPAQTYFMGIQQKAYRTHITKLQQEYGGNNIPPELIQQAKQQAVQFAHQHLSQQKAIAVAKQQQQAVAAQNFSQQQQAMMAQMNQNVGARGMGAMGAMQ